MALGTSTRVLVLLSVGFLGQEAHEYPVLTSETSGYVVVIDAGSGGSRIHVFSYKDRNFDAKEFPLIVGRPITLPQELAVFTTRPGISSFVNHTDDLASSLLPLLKSGADALLLFDPKQRLDEVPVYLGATAGMRLLRERDIVKVMKEVHRILKGPGNPFSFANVEQARVLSGEEEGVFAWLALNYKYGWITSSASETYGSLDFGGGSMQIAFEPKGPIMAGFFPLHIGTYAGRGPIHLYAHSFLEFGFKAARQRSLVSLMRRYNTTAHGVIKHPCWPMGSSLQFEVVDEDFFVRNASSRRELAQTGLVHLEGGGDFAECYRLASTLIHEGPCYQPPCSMLGTYQPFLADTNFVILGELGDMTEWMVKAHMHDGNVPILEALHAQLETICALPLPTQIEMFGKGLFGHKGVPPCWRGVWMLAMLVEGLGFPRNTTQISVKRDCCDISPGQAIYEVNFFPYKIEKSNYRDTLALLADVGEGGVRQQRLGLLIQGAILGACFTLALLWPLLARSRRGHGREVSGVPLLL